MCEIEEVSNDSNSNFPPSVEIDGNIQQIEPSNQNEQINQKKRNIFEVTLNEPRAKKGRKRHELKQPLPIPIETLTGVKADDSLWRFYKGKLDPAKKIVVVENPEDAFKLGIWGYFGSRGDPKFKKGANKVKNCHNTLVILEDFEPVISTTMESVTGSCQENANEDSDVEICEEEKDASNHGGSLEDADSASAPASDPSSPASVDDEKQTAIQLSPVEAFFLAFGLGCLLVECPKASFVEDPELSIDDLWSIFCSYDKDFPYQYAVYHHFRAKGYVVKDGTKFGCDFLLYKEGPPFYHAHYSVRIMQPHQNRTWQFISGLNRVTESAGKELLLAQVTEDEEIEEIDLEINPNSSNFSDIGTIKPNQHTIDSGNFRKQGQTVKQKLKRIHVTEVLFRRFITTEEREKQNS